jgi:hypothetical protein
MSAIEQKARTRVVRSREVVMAPYLIFAVGPNGHFVNVKEIMASSDAAALERASQLRGGRKIGGLSARRRTPSILTLCRGWISLIRRHFTSLALLTAWTA